MSQLLILKKIIPSNFESVKIYWLLVKFDWFKYLKRGYCKSVKFHWLFQWKLTDLTVRNIVYTDESVKINWFKSGQYFFTDESVKINWFNRGKYFFTDESVKINWFNSGQYFFTDESVKRQITDSISDNLTDSDLESSEICNF